MLCPLCDSDEEFTLVELQAHLQEIHKYNDDALVRFGENYAQEIQEQIRLEGKA